MLPNFRQQRDPLAGLPPLKWMSGAHTRCFTAAGQSRREGNLQEWDGIGVCGGFSSPSALPW